MRMSFSWVMPPMPVPSVRMKYRLLATTGCTGVGGSGGLCADGNNWGCVCGTW